MSKRIPIARVPLDATLPLTDVPKLIEALREAAT